jgi:hypothetical protein
MQALLGLPSQRRHHARMTVTGGTDRDSGHKIEEAIAVHVENARALPAAHGERVWPSVHLRNHALVTRKQCLRSGAGNLQSGNAVTGGHF